MVGTTHVNSKNKLLFLWVISLTERKKERLAIDPFSQKLTTHEFYIAAHAASCGYNIKALPLAAGDFVDEAM